MATKSKSTTSKVVKQNKIKCSDCGKEKALNPQNFFKSNREEYSETGYCTTCKNCLVNSTVDDNGNITMESIKYAIRKLDKPLVEKVFMEVKNKKDNDGKNVMANNKFLGAYSSQINLYEQYKDCRYSDTVDIQIEQEKRMSAKVEEVKKIEVTDAIVLFWGRGLGTQDYLDLQSMYDSYTLNEKGMTKKKQEDYKNLCIYELQKSKIHFDLSRIADTQKLQGLIDNLSSSLGIQAVQKMDDDKNERFTLGLLARYHEDIHKQPIRRWVEDLGGIDPIDMKIKVYYKGGILNAMGIQNPEFEEYKKEVDQYTVQIKEIEEHIRQEKEKELDG